MLSIKKPRQGNRWHLIAKIYTHFRKETGLLSILWAKLWTRKENQTVSSESVALSEDMRRRDYYEQQ